MRYENGDDDEDDDDLFVCCSSLQLFISLYIYIYTYEHTPTSTYKYIKCPYPLVHLVVRRSAHHAFGPFSEDRIIKKRERERGRRKKTKGGRKEKSITGGRSEPLGVYNYNAHSLSDGGGFGIFMYIDVVVHFEILEETSYRLDPQNL